MASLRVSDQLCHLLAVSEVSPCTDAERQSPTSDLAPLALPQFVLGLKPKVTQNQNSTWPCILQWKETSPPKLLFLDERALAFAQRLGRLFGRNVAENLVVVPFCLGFARRLNLDEIHIVHHAAVLAHSSLGEEIVDRQLPYFVCDCFAVRRPRCLNRFEIVQHR